MRRRITSFATATLLLASFAIAVLEIVPFTLESIDRVRTAQAGPDMTTVFVNSFASLKPRLHDKAQLPFWTDPPLRSLFGGKNMLVSGSYCLAQYALAPIVLVDAEEDDTQVLLISSDVGRLRAEVERRNAIVVQQVTPHSALVERRLP